MKNCKENLNNSILELVKNGIFTDEKTGKEYFTGYSYKTLFDWDQYFETIVQINLKLNLDYAKNGVMVFLELQKEDGFIVRRNLIFYPSCESEEHAKPFFAQIVLLLLKKEGNIKWFTEEYFERMEKYLNYWLINEDRNKNGLPSWKSAPHSGMDNHHERAGYWSEGYCEGVDLASYLYRDLIAFSLICEHLKKADKKNHYELQAEKLKELILKNMWNEEDSFFYDINEKTGQQIKCKTIAGFMPLWAKIASKEQADKMIKRYLINEKEFWRNFPVSAMAASEEGYSEVLLEKDLGCNWRANTWIPTNYIAMHILNYYGYADKAMEIAKKTQDVLNTVGSREYYTSDSVEGCGLNPFWGWSLLGYFMKDELENKIDRTSLNLNIFT